MVTIGRHRSRTGGNECPITIRAKAKVTTSPTPRCPSAPRIEARGPSDPTRGFRGAAEGSARLRAEGAGPGARHSPPLTDRADLRDVCRGADLRRAGRTDEPQPADVHGVRLRGPHRKGRSRTAVRVAGKPRLLTQRRRSRVLRGELPLYGVLRSS